MDILMLTIAKVIKRNEIAKEIQIALTAYGKDPSQDNQDKLSAMTLLWQTKDIIEKQGVEGLMDKTKMFEAAERLFCVKDKQN